MLLAALSACSPDPVGEVKETTLLCASQQRFSAIVDANISNPNYEVVVERDDQVEVAIAGTVAYLGRPIRIDVSVDDDTPTDFTVAVSDLDPEHAEALRDPFCAGELALADEFGARMAIAARVDRARQSHGAIARMILIEEQSPDELANLVGDKEPFRVIDGAILEIPLSDIFGELPQAVIHMVPRQATRMLLFSCMTNLPYELYSLVPDDCQNPLDPDYGEEPRPSG